MRYVPYAVVLLAYLAGMFVDIMEIDATQYAVMSRDMLRAGDLMHLVDRGKDYLDKPPLIFWCTALSYKLFGVSTFAYKLPSVLFALLGIFSTERLARIFYGREKAFLAGLILATTQGFFLMNNDVKTDMYLIGALAFTLWQIAAYLENPRWDRLVLGFVGIGVAMLGKGPLGLVAPAMVIGAHLLLRRDWRNILRWQWLVGLVVTGLMILPFCVALNQQFGEEGVRFFLWTQSFGRVTGESEWANDADAFFLVHTFAWSFLPWTLLALGGWGRRLVQLVRQGFKLRKSDSGPNGNGLPEDMAIAGFTLLFIALSLSRFKLPHYIFIVFPFAAILAADFLGDLILEPNLRRWARTFFGIHLGIFILGTLAVSALTVWAFPGAPWWVWALLAAGIGGISFALIRSQSSLWRHLLPTALGFAFFNLLLNAHLYPTLLAYQSSGVAGRYVKQAELPLERVYAYGKAGRAMDFYSGQVMEWAPDPHNWEAENFMQTGAEPVWIYLSEKDMELFRQTGHPIEVVEEFEHFRVARLSLKFINPATRADAVGRRYLIRLGPKPAAQ